MSCSNFDFSWCINENNLIITKTKPYFLKLNKFSKCINENFFGIFDELQLLTVYQNKTFTYITQLSHGMYIYLIYRFLGFEV